MDKKQALEKMSNFFTARVNGYDKHMLNEVKGCKEAYQKLAELIPIQTEKILDLGCGTGLELEGIFNRLPYVSVVGIDLTQSMLDVLKQKYADKNIKLICGNYFNVNLGKNIFDTAISFQTLHHFPHADKVGLYTKIYKALKSSGTYIEVDYMVMEQSLEDQFYAENDRLRREMSIPDGEFYHFDTPCTIENQISMFKQAGFATAEMVFRKENNTIIITKK
jgi:ubiquinone/menaquinone biosynthesis C-methylase UbiE